MYKPRMALFLSVPKFGSKTERIDYSARVLSAKWTRNDHLKADELTVTLDWRDGGVDPRIMRDARCQFYLWDAERYGEDVTEAVHQDAYRFSGIAYKVQRKLSEHSRTVDISFHDYTSLFLGVRPFPSEGRPDWTDTLETAWAKICDHTGYKDLESGKWVSSVEALRDKIKIEDPELQGKTLKEIEPSRYHAVSKPTFPLNCDGWTVWQYICGSLGLVTYIDKDECIVSSAPEHFTVYDAPFLIYGDNIIELEEETDATITMKGVHLISFDHLNGKIIEAVYPPPGDPRLKAHRAIAKRALKEGRDPNLNEVSPDYEPYYVWEIQTQAALEKKAQAVYEERKRQQLDGKLKTGEMVVFDAKENEIDLLDLRAGDAIRVGLTEESFDVLRSLPGDADRIRYLVDHCGYTETVAFLVVDNMKDVQIGVPFFHVKQVEVSFEEENFVVEIGYHNLILEQKSNDPPVDPNQLSALEAAQVRAQKRQF